MVCCLLKGAEYANKLNFTNIDLPALQNFLFGVVKALRFEKSDASNDLGKAINVSDVLEQFLGSKRMRHTLYTDKIHRRPGKAAAGDISIKRAVDKLESVHVHVALEDKVLRIGKSYLQDWLHKNGQPVAAIMKAIVEEFNATTEQARLGAGTEYNTGKVYMYEINLTKNPELNFIDEA